MKLVSLKRTEEERKRDEGTVMQSAPGESPDYPWGTRLRLDDEQLAALGWKDLPPVGAECAIEARGFVMSVSDEAVDNGKSNRHVEIQITDLAVNEPGKALNKRMYPGGKS